MQLQYYSYHQVEHPSDCLHPEWYTMHAIKNLYNLLPLPLSPLPPPQSGFKLMLYLMMELGPNLQVVHDVSL